MSTSTLKKSVCWFLLFFSIVLLLGYYIISTGVVQEYNKGISSTSSTSTINNVGKEVKNTVTQSSASSKNLSLSGQLSTADSTKILSQLPSQKMVFQKPNLEWKTRRILIDDQWVTYEFGKGNPREVALSIDQIKEKNKQCALHNMASVLYKSGFCNPETEYFRYVSPEVEKYLSLALSDPNWVKLATECEQNFRFTERDLTPEIINQTLLGDSSFLYFDRVFKPGFLNMENFLTIDPSTGLKHLNANIIRSFSYFLARSSHLGYRGSGIQNPYGDCVDRYGLNIARNMSIVDALYNNPVDFVH